MRTRKTMTMKEYMALQVRFLLFKSQTDKIDCLAAAEIYAPRLSDKIRNKYDVQF